MGAFRRMLNSLAVVTAVAALLLGLVWAFQRSLIYIPIGEPGSPAAVGLAGAEEIAFPTADGLTLAGWLVPARREGPGPAVLVFNGNAGNRSFRAPLASALSAAGLTTLLFDYRGYGGNPGRPTEAGLAADARAARAFLATREEVDPAAIVYFGESLGAAVAIELATEHPPAALILRSPFTSLVDAGRYHYPFLPVGWLLQDRYPSLDTIGGLSCPLLVIAGDADRIIPTEQSRRLFAAAPEPKRLALIPGAGHNDYELLAGELLLAEMGSFLKELGLL